MSPRAVLALLLGPVCAVACNALTGVDDVEFGSQPAGTSGGTSSGTGGAGDPCSPGDAEDCYSGPAGTQDVGLCVGGTRTCEPSGTFGPCAGEVTPAAETCVTQGDEDCDGMLNEDGEGCGCRPGSTQPCYGGPDGTQNVGICVAGTQQCNSDGNGFGRCMGQVTPGVEDCNAVGDEDCDGSACSETIWAQRFGDGGDQRVDGIAFGIQGNILVTGRFGGTITFGALPPLTSTTGDDTYVVKLDPQGSPIWARHFAGGGDQRPRDIAIDGAGNVVVAGGFSGSIDFGAGPVNSVAGDDAFVVKLDPDGATVWSAILGGNNEQIFVGVAIHPSGDPIVTGSLSGSATFGAFNLQSNNGRDVVVARLASASGSPVWAKIFGAAGDQWGYETECDTAGNIVLSGPLQGSVDFGGGNLTSFSTGAFLAKLDGQGNHVWSKGFNPTGQLILPTVGVDAQGNVVVGGELTGSVDFGGGAVVSAGNNVDDAVLAAFDAAGTHLWSARYGDAADQYVFASAVDGSGDVTVVGHVSGTADFGGGPLTSANQYAPYVTKLDGQGAHIYSRLYGNGGDDASAGALLCDVAIDPSSGRVGVAFPVVPAIDMGTGVLPAAGNFDVVIAVLAP